MHRLLKRQIKKLFGEEVPSQEYLQSLLSLVDETYYQFQDDYNKLERILELSSKESFKELNNFKSAIDTAALVSLTDNKADILLANQNFCTISGFSLGELIGKNHNIINSGYHPKSFFEEMWTTIGSGKIWQGEICNRKKNGDLYWVDSTIIPFLDDNGKPFQYLSIRFDITTRKKFEEEIKTLALVAKKTQNAVIISDTNGIAIWANEGFERITEYKVEDLLGKRPGELLQGIDTNPETIKEIGTALKNKTLYNGEILNYSKTGRPYWISLSITPMLEDNKHMGYIAIEGDITERKKFEQKLQENEKLLRAINDVSAELLANSNFENAIGKALNIIGTTFKVNRVHIMKNNVDSRGVINSYSQKFQWQNNQILINNPEIQNMVYEEVGLERWKVDLSKNKIINCKIEDLPEKEQYRFKPFNVFSIVALPIFIYEEFWGFLALDTCTEGAEWGQNHEQILRNVAGNIGSAFERHETENRLKENEEKFRLLIESATDIFYYTDSTGNFTYVNDISTQITGYSTQELLKMNYLDLVEPNQRKRVESFYKKQAFLGKKVTYNEFPITTKSGKIAWIGQNVQLIETEDNKRGIQAIARDITSLKNAQIEIENSHNFLNEIIDSIPNPLFVKNRKQEWIMVNNAYTKLTGISKKQILGNRDSSFLPEKVAESFLLEDEKQFQELGERVREVVYQNPDGLEKILLVKKSIYQNLNDQFLIALITDITDIKEREKEILLYNKISDQISDAISVADYQGNLIYVNESHARNLNKSKQQLIGSTIMEMEKIFPTVEAWQLHYNEVKHLGGQLIEGTNLKSDGTEFPVEASVKYVNIENKGYIVAAIRDISDRKKAEQEIYNMKEFYENVLNKIPSDVVVFDKDHRYLFVNEIAVKDPEKRKWLVGHNDYEYCEHFNKSREIADTRRKIFDKVVANKGQLEFEENLNGPNKEPIWMLRRFYPILDKSNQIVTIIGFGIDITTRKLAEEKIRENEERLKLATSSANLGIWDWNLTENKLIWDASMYRIFNVDPKQFTNDYEAFEKTLHPEDRLNVGQEISDALKGNYDFKSVFRVITDTGETKFINAVSKTFRDEGNIPYRMIGVNFDVTEATLIQQKILKQQQDLEEAQHIAKVGGWDIDVKAKNIVWSKEMFNICEVDHNLQPSLNDTYSLFTPDTKEQMIQAFFNAIENHEEFELEAQIISGKKNIIDVRTKGIPFLENGKVLAIRGIFQDVTQEKAASRLMQQYLQELEKKNKELDQFAYVVSHDLKAPLRGINNLSMWIEEDMEGKLEVDTKNNLDLMRKRVKRMEGLIDGILQYSRAGRIKHEAIPFNLYESINELISNMAPSEKFKISIQEDMPIITTEKIAIEQVFANYISNAIKYNNNPNPTIDITYKQNNNFYEFCVSDNGPGIEKEFHEKVFVIFQTLQARDTFESTGVGLAIVKKMVEDKGGSVWIESEMGVGTKFFFSWPITEIEA